MKNIMLTLFLLFMSLACKNNSELEDSWSFNIDSTKISEPQNIEGFAVDFHPPINWKEVEADISDRIVNSLKSQQEGASKYTYKPEKVYLNKSNSSLLTVGTVTSGHSNSSDHLNRYIDVVTDNFKESITKKSSFQKDKTNFIQFLIQKQNLVSYKIVFLLGDTIYQFDYNIQKESYEQELKSIESSIGTIKPKIIS